MCTRTESNGYSEKCSACASLYNYFVEKRLIRSMGDPPVVLPRFRSICPFLLVKEQLYSKTIISSVLKTRRRNHLLFFVRKLADKISSSGPSDFAFFFQKKLLFCGNFRVQAHVKLRPNRPIVCFHSNICVTKNLLDI